MDLSSTYLGFHLPHPFMPGASPLVDDLDMVKRLEDAGAAAIVMHSLFEEQIAREQTRTLYDMDTHAESFSEALSYFPNWETFTLGPEQYLEKIRRIKEAVAVPVIGSLNGSSATGWLNYSALFQEAGADALELNLYFLTTDSHESGETVERRAVEIVRTVKETVTIPVAVKLSPFFCSLPHFAQQLDQFNTDGLVLFNRFYQPDIDVETLEVVPSLQLSDSSELLLRLRWLAILSGHLKASLAITGGVHTPVDAIKAIMTGAHAVQLVSALLTKGPEFLHTIRQQVIHWMEEHEYESLQQMQGSMNLQRCPDASAFERANYIRVIESWRP